MSGESEARGEREWLEGLREEDQLAAISECAECGGSLDEPLFETVCVSCASQSPVMLIEPLQEGAS